jgi:YggT family protein
MSALASYARFVGIARIVLFYGAIVAAAICGVDWAVRTRRINPFSRVARFFRGRIDPMLLPVERVVVRGGGLPSAAAWWGLVAYILGAILLITLLQFGYGILYQALAAMAEPSEAWRTLLSWVFSILQLALLVRVFSSWFAISPYSKWIRWSYVLTNWLVLPLQRVVPRLGMFDISPLVAWFILWLLQGVVGTL